MSNIPQAMENEKPKVILQRKNAIYYNNGKVSIAISEDGLPSGIGLVPAPMMDEMKRHKLTEDTRKAIWLDGCFIESERRVRNEVFDKPGEKTTTEFKIRTCKNTSEASFVLSKIREFGKEEKP